MPVCQFQHQRFCATGGLLQKAEAKVLEGHSRSPGPDAIRGIIADLIVQSVIYKSQESLETPRERVNFRPS